MRPAWRVEKAGRPRLSTRLQLYGREDEVMMWCGMDFRRGCRLRMDLTSSLKRLPLAEGPRLVLRRRLQSGPGVWRIDLLGRSESGDRVRGRAELELPADIRPGGATWGRLLATALACAVGALAETQPRGPVLSFWRSPTP